MSKHVTHPGVVVGVDGSAGSKVAVAWAARDAELRNVPLTLVHVVPATAGPCWTLHRFPSGCAGSENEGAN